MVKHIIFDCDGVLIDTEIVAAEVVSKWLNEEGVAINVDEFIHRFTGKTFTDIIEILKSAGELSSAVVTKTVVPTLDEHIRNNQRPIVNVWPMLESIGQPLSVVSNSASDYVAEALEKLEISHHFENRIFSADMVKKGKPSPEVYELAIDQLGYRKEELLVVEDSVAGVTASVAAGLQTIGFLGGSHVRDGHGDTLMQAGAKVLANDHLGLQALLGEML